MPVKFDVTIQTKAPVAKAIDYYMHVENLPKVHPNFIKGVTVKAHEGDSVSFEQQMEMMGRKLSSNNKLWLDRANNTLNIDTLDGDGKGSKIMMAIKDVPSGTEIHYSAAMELGPLGFFAKGPARSAFEKAAQEDKQQLDTLS